MQIREYLRNDYLWNTDKIYFLLKLSGKHFPNNWWHKLVHNKLLSKHEHKGPIVTVIINTCSQLPFHRKRYNVDDCKNSMVTSTEMLCSSQGHIDNESKVTAKVIQVTFTNVTLSHTSELTCSRDKKVVKVQISFKNGDHIFCNGKGQRVPWLSLM